MTLRIPFCGNPRWYSTFLDESLNLVLAGVAAASHKATWERSIFDRMRLLPIVSKGHALARVPRESLRVDIDGHGPRQRRDARGKWRITTERWEAILGRAKDETHDEGAQLNIRGKKPRTMSAYER
eukprot:7226119-Pyramimonas_sp.AAC.1